MINPVSGLFTGTTIKAWHERTGYPLLIIKDASHNSNKDNPSEVKSLIREYIRKWTDR